MASATLGLSAELLEHLRRFGVRESAALKALRDETASLEQGAWQMPPEQGQIMALIGMIHGPDSYVELGTFTGYGTLWMAGALPQTTEIITCERFEQFAEIAKRHWTEAGVASRIDLRMVDAIDLLETLLGERGEDSVGMVFIDADKKPYPDYYERAARLVRPGGLILIDNAFRGGGVVDPDDTSKATAAVRRVTEMVHSDLRMDMGILPVSDGLIIARKR